MKKTYLLALSVLSSLSILFWVLTEYIAGLSIFLIFAFWLIIPLNIGFIITLVFTVINWIKEGYFKSKYEIYIHGLVIAIICVSLLFNSRIIRSKKIIEATLADDLSHFTLVLRKNGNCENKVFGMFGYTETYYGHYTLNGDTIIFRKKPYDNDFIPDTVLLDIDQRAIYLEKDKHGNFRTKKEWLNHFEIQKIDLNDQ